MKTTRIFCATFLLAILTWAASASAQDAEKSGGVISLIKKMVGAKASTTPAGGGTVVGEGGGAEDFKVFVYTPDETGGVNRILMEASEYEEFKREEVSTRLFGMYLNFLSGNFEAHIADGVTPEQAQLMVAVDPVIMGRIAQSEEYKAELANQMAEWDFFYAQLGLWSQYVEEKVLRKPMAENEKIPFNPAFVEQILPGIYKKLESQGAESVQEQKSLYDQMVDVINKSRVGQVAYETWFDQYKEDLALFADLWARRYDGSEIRINNVLYVVRNISERPANPMDDYAKDSLPRNAVLLDVPKEKIVTPFDLIREDGSLRTPEDY